MKNFNSILEAINTYAASTPNKLCLADINDEVTYAEFWERICNISALFIERGLSKGQYVVAKASQTVNFMALCHGVQLAGGVIVPLEKNAIDEMVYNTIKITGAAFFVGDLPVEGCETLSIGEVTGYKANGERSFVLPDKHSESMILFTTGTTGKSKGIVLDYHSEIAVAQNILEGVKMKENNIEIIPMPMSHSFSLRRYYANIINGSSVVLIDGVIFVKVLFDMLDKYHATSIGLNPPALAIVFRLSKERLGEYSNQLDYVELSSAPLPEAEKKQLQRLLPKSRLYNIYGSTEAGCSLCLDFSGKDDQPNCVGYPTCNSIVRVIDADGNEIKSSAENTGFLSYGGSMMMQGYFKDPHLTAQTLQNGYITSTDVGYIDENGKVFMLGRVDDIISTGAYKVAPEEIEEVAIDYPGVNDCACIAVSDSIMGKVPQLCITVSGEFDVQAYHRFLSQKLESYKCPKKIVVVSEIPRTYNGKLKRNELRKQFGG